MNKLRYLYAKILFSVIVLFLSNAAFAQPAITSFTPATSPIGTLVSITGAKLNNPTIFSLGGVAAISISKDSGKQVRTGYALFSLKELLFLLGLS